MTVKMLKETTAPLSEVKFLRVDHSWWPHSCVCPHKGPSRLNIRLGLNRTKRLLHDNW